MTDSSDENLLANLNLLTGSVGKNSGKTAENPFEAMEATVPEHHEIVASKEERHLDELIGKINGLTKNLSSKVEKSPTKETDVENESKNLKNRFVPKEPTSLSDCDLTDAEVEAISLKYLLARGSRTGRSIAEQVKLPFVIIDELLRALKNDRLVVHRGDAPMNDYEYELTDIGRERARRHSSHCTYFGSAPVALADYVGSVNSQSLAKQRPSIEDLRNAFKDLLLNEKMFKTLGPAINSGRGLFLYGFPGNGKTSIAERVTGAFGKHIWIPRTIGVAGEIIRLFDPAIHEEVPVANHEGLLDQRKIDRRWVRIRRPTIIAAGELTMSALEVSINKSTGISEAPLQLKSNCGTLVIDDFGRQRMSIDELLNRWILPLEKRYDFLNLPNGQKIQVPFDQLIIFSTNLEPRDLVDEAFLRRIPYKIEVVDPTEEEFRELFKMMTEQLGFKHSKEPIDYLIEKYYKSTGRPFRCCHPRDLLLQVRSFCAFAGQRAELTPEYFDIAVSNYFAMV